MRRVFVLILTFHALLLPIPAMAQDARPIVFVVDTSGSMRGEKIASVRSAVTEVVSNLKPEIPVGLYSFNSQVIEVLPPTTNRNLAYSRLKDLKATGSTALFDAIDRATMGLGVIIPSRVIILSDGGDTVSKLSYEALIKTLSQRGIPVDVIGLQVKSKASEVLSKIALVTSGGYYALNDIGSLILVYKEILGDKLVTAPVSSAPLLIKVLRNSAVEYTLSFIAALVVFLTFFAIRAQIKQKRLISARFATLQKYAFRSSRSAASRIRQAITSYSFIPNKVETYMRENLELIQFKAKYETVVKGLLVIFFIAVATFSLMFQNIFVGLLLAFAVPAFVFKYGVKYLFEKQKRQFDEELPEMLNVVASGLNAGLGLQQSLEAFATDSSGEASRQLRRAIGEIRVGTPTDEALMAVANRMKSDDLKWAVTALSIQRLVGGSMSTILRTAYETIRTRAEIRREVRTLAAEGRLSATVLMALPILIFAFLILTRREYVSVFWHKPLGILLLVVVTFNMSVGWAWMKKIVDIKI